MQIFYNHVIIIGPHTWHGSFPSAGGCRQSPINIELDKLKYDITLNIRPLTVAFDIERQLSQTLVYTGHNFRIDVAGGSCSFDVDTRFNLSYYLY